MSACAGQAPKAHLAPVLYLTSLLYHNLSTSIRFTLATVSWLPSFIPETLSSFFPLEGPNCSHHTALAVDMTARNLQDRVKKAGLPWSAAKGFDTFTPIGSFIPSSDIEDAQDLQLTLKINGVTKQEGSTGDMMFKIPQLIEHVSSIMTLEEGDLLLTGTPPGVGPLVAGDKVECRLEDREGRKLDELVFEAVQRRGGWKFQD